jgi:hypothetical protein
MSPKKGKTSYLCSVSEVKNLFQAMIYQLESFLKKFTITAPCYHGETHKTQKYYGFARLKVAAQRKKITSSVQRVYVISFTDARFKGQN